MDRHPELIDSRLLPQTLPLLRSAVERHPLDMRAREAFAFSLERQGNLAQAVAQMVHVLEQPPPRESSLAAAASMLSSVDQWAGAAELWGQARDVNPWIVRYWYQLAVCYARLGRWNECAATCEQTLERFPDSFGARQLLIECWLLAGRRRDAEREYQRLIELNPPQVQAVRRWWENHPRRQQTSRQ